MLAQLFCALSIAQNALCLQQFCQMSQKMESQGSAMVREPTLFL